MPQRLSRPPFVIGNCAAIAYVNGRYIAPGAKTGPVGFLGIYVAKKDPRLSFWTFDVKGERLAFHTSTTDELDVNFALIDGWLNYAVPFDQWRWYQVGKSETRALQRMKLIADYNEARNRLAIILCRARLTTYFDLPDVEPMFAIHLRSTASMKKDLAERDAVLRAGFLVRRKPRKQNR